MKVVFLDIDGVLNSTRTCVAFKGYPHELHGDDRKKFDKVAIALIRKIVAKADACVVLSSSWRIIHDYRAVGEAFALPIIDRTPSLPGCRGDEIADWLDKHPEVTSYVIVDDDADMLEEQMDRFVQTSDNDGFRWVDAVRMADLLGVSIFDVNREDD